MTSSTPTPSGAPMDSPAVEQRLDPATRTIIAVLLVSSFVVILNETIMSVAIPQLMTDLHISAAVAQWLTTAFMLTMAVVIPITGWLLQRLTTRTVFILAMSLFSAGTLTSALAPGFPMLLVGRIVQASGTAVMMPLLMTTIMTLVPVHLRGRTMGNITIVMAVAPAVGPTLSGIILSALDWRWIFLIVLPIALAGLILGAFKVRNVGETRRIPVDMLSVLLSAFAFGGLIFGLSSIGEAVEGGGAVNPFIPTVIGVVSLGAFIARQIVLARDDRALLDLRIFRSRTFTLSLVIMSVAMLSMFGAIIILPIYMQSVLGTSPIGTGLAMLPGSLLMGLLGPVIGRAYDRLGTRPLVVPGTVLVTASLTVMALTLDADSSVYFVVAAHVLLSLGLGFIMTPMFSTSLGSLPQRLYSHGSAMLGTVQQVAAGAGTALFITVFTLGSVVLSPAGAGEVAALAHGVNWAFIAGAGVSLVPIVLACLLPGKTAAEAPDASEEAVAPA